MAVALPPAEPGVPVPTSEFLVGCMLPDLAAIARVRVTRPDGDMGRGVEFHHACDAVFHESQWFRAANRELRDALLTAGVDSGPARACSHAGVEMLLDGGLVEDAAVGAAARRTLDAVDAGASALGALADAATRAVWVERLHLVGSSLEPRRYADVEFVAERLHRMTAGRRRIELRADHIGAVARALADHQLRIRDAAPRIVSAVREAVPSHLRPA